jgi:SAM-dependent methyltransferase
MSRPESIENRWDILYRDYPEVYDEFSHTPYHPTSYEQLARIIDLRGKVIADVGAGTGESCLALARSARQVIGIEIETAMLRQARAKLRGEGAVAGTWAQPAGPTDRIARGDNIALVNGDALALPLADDSVDLVTGITLALYPPPLYRAFIDEGRRVARGPVVYLGIAPGWYGGDLHDVIDDPGQSTEPVDDVIDRIFREEFGFDYEDVFCNQDYGTVEHIVSTYGFIFGRKTIEYLRRERKTTILWKFRVFW